MKNAFTQTRKLIKTKCCINLIKKDIIKKHLKENSIENWLNCSSISGIGHEFNFM